MSKLKKISGTDCIKILCNQFNFSIVRIKGSHFILKKRENNKIFGVVVPLHKELKIGTLKAILKIAEIEETNFEKYQ